jgi:hypothetical protein
MINKYMLFGKAERKTHFGEECVDNRIREK